MHVKQGITHSSVVDAIVRHIEQRIEKAELVAGQRLHEETCAAEWGVSRASLREAFRVLESQGYVDRLPRKGVFVSRVTAEQVRDVYQVRSVLEGLAVRLMVEKGDAQVLARLEELDRLMRQAFAAGNPARRAALNQEFHQLLIQASGSELLARQLSPINKIIKRCRAIAHADPDLLPSSDDTHTEIIEFMRKGQALEAEARRRARIVEYGQYIIERIPAV